MPKYLACICVCVCLWFGRVWWCLDASAFMRVYNWFDIVSSAEHRRKPKINTHTLAIKLVGHSLRIDNLSAVPSAKTHGAYTMMCVRLLLKELVCTAAAVAVCVAHRFATTCTRQEGSRFYNMCSAECSCVVYTQQQQQCNFHRTQKKMCGKSVPTLYVKATATKKQTHTHTTWAHIFTAYRLLAAACSVGGTTFTLYMPPRSTGEQVACLHKKPQTLKM